MAAATFRADQEIFDEITEIAKTLPSTKGTNKTLIHLVKTYRPNKDRMKEMERTIAELQQFKHTTLQMLKLEDQLRVCKDSLIKSANSSNK